MEGWQINSNMQRVAPDNEVARGITFIGNTGATSEIDHLFRGGKDNKVYLQTGRLEGIKSGHAQLIGILDVSKWEKPQNGGAFQKRQFPKRIKIPKSHKNWPEYENLVEVMVEKWRRARIEKP